MNPFSALSVCCKFQNIIYLVYDKERLYEIVFIVIYQQRTYVCIIMVNIQYISCKQQNASFVNLYYQLVVTTFLDSILP